MSSAIQINPKTGKKSFNTRAAKAHDKITGKGYSTIRDEKLTSLPLFSVQLNKKNIGRLKKSAEELQITWHWKESLASI